MAKQEYKPEQIVTLVPQFEGNSHSAWYKSSTRSGCWQASGLAGSLAGPSRVTRASARAP